MVTKISPLRWIGSKTKMMGRLRLLLPNSFDYFIEPFAGSAETSLMLIKEGWIEGSQVWINDKNFALIAFWQTLQNRPYELISALLSLYEEHGFGDHDLFQRACDEIQYPSDDKLNLAMYFYVMNRLVYAGLSPNQKKTEEGRKSGKWAHFTNPKNSRGGLRENAIKDLLDYSILLRGVKITCLDFAKIVPPTDNTFAFLDPPYRLGWRRELQYYGFIFHHRRFAKWCSKLKPKCSTIITYDVNDKHLDSFQSWNTFKHDVDYLSAKKGYYELLFTNYEIPLPNAMGGEWQNLKAVNDNSAPALPEKKYEIIYADPPWPYYGDPKKSGAAGKHYSLMEIEDIKAMDIQSITAENAVCFMWATSPKLDMALETLKSWGFTYNNVCFIWRKATKEMVPITLSGPLGSFTKVGNTEFLLIGSTAKDGKSPWKGQGIHIRGSRIKQWWDLEEPIVVDAVRMEHSRKPDIFRELIVELVGDKSRVELFARRAANDNDGFDVWGNQAAS